MFTGIVTDIGEIVSVDEGGKSGDRRFVIATKHDLAAVPIGASIACSGCCLTVVEKADGRFAVDVSAESLSKTHLGAWKTGSKLNLELSLKLGDELGGHLVYGHVDGVGKIVALRQEGQSWRFSFQAPSELMRYIAQKGSICVEGISLTVNEVEGDVFGVNLIPHTFEHTTLGRMTTGQSVNLEIDALARYVERIRTAN